MVEEHLPKVTAFGVEELEDGQVEVEPQLEGVVEDDGRRHGLEGIGVPERREAGREGGGGEGGRGRERWKEEGREGGGEM